VPGIPDVRVRKQLRAAIAASETTRKTTSVISKNVNVPRVNTFKAAVISRYDNRLNSVVTKKIDNVSAAVFV
jgi:hypothetical protein